MRLRARAALSALLLLPLAVPGVLAAAQQPPATGAEEPVFVIPHLSGPIVLDGRVDEPAWERIEPLPSAMHIPDYGAPSSERTEFRVAHDGGYLYFSCRAYDSEPAGIVATSLRRDNFGRTSDSCAIYLDNFNDEENAIGFLTTPSGLRTDFDSTNDGSVFPNFDWSTYWDTAVSQDEHGWYAEMRIPFSSFSFKSEEGRVVMGMAARRMIGRKTEMITHPAMSPSHGSFAYRKPSLMRTVVLEGVERLRPIYVTPYALGGRGATQVFSVADGRYHRDTDWVREAGVDIKYGLTSNLTLDLTVNTDFAQVEADDQQVNLTRFSLFFPEKRRFFQERGGIFEYPLGGNERLFHSRRMGLEDGEPVRIYGGGRLVGRIGDWDVGMLSIQTAESDRLPSENESILRFRRRVLNANSYVGGITTSRIGSGGHHNVAYGLDGFFRVVGLDFLTLNWAQTFEGQALSAGGEPAKLLDRSLFRLSWARRGQDGLTYLLDLTRAGSAFDPGLGFLLRRDYAKVDFVVGHGWRPGRQSRFLTYRVQLDGSVFRRNQDDAVETIAVAPTVVIDTRRRHTFNLSFPFRYENLETGFDLPSGVSVPPGTYRFTSARLRYGAPQGNRFRPSVVLEAGEFFGGRQASVSFIQNWNRSMHLSMNGAYRLDYVEFPDRDQSFTAHVARLKVEVMFNTITSVVGFIQYNSTQNAVVANFRLHVTPRDGNDLYIVWNEGISTDRNSFDPVRPLSNERTLLLKYSHTLQFRH